MKSVNLFLLNVTMCLMIVIIMQFYSLIIPLLTLFGVFFKWPAYKLLNISSSINRIAVELLR